MREGEKKREEGGEQKRQSDTGSNEMKYEREGGRKRERERERNGDNEEVGEKQLTGKIRLFHSESV
jgi:hypothetical protein